LHKEKQFKLNNSPVYDMKNCRNYTKSIFFEKIIEKIYAI